MRDIRIYVDEPLASGAELTLPAQAAHHVARVLRLRAGQTLTLFNGDGGEYAAVIRSAGGRRVAVDIGEHRRVERESPLDITLVQAISRGRHMDYTLQKAVELGIRRVVPVFSDHGQVRLDDRRRQARLEHWHGVVIAACEQSGRDRLPVVEEPIRFGDWLGTIVEEQWCLLLDPAADRRLRDLPAPGSGIALVAGPEGGFSEAEREAARQSGCIAIGLGPRVLRTETAAPAAITACQALWGDLG